MQLRLYEKSIIAAVPIGLALCTWYLVSLHASGFASIALGSVILPLPITVLIGIIFITGSLVSGASYIGRALDTLKKPLAEQSYEGQATIAGVFAGAGIGAILILAGVNLPFLAAVPIIPQIVFVIATIAVVAGLFARIFRVIDRKVGTSPDRIIKADLDEQIENVTSDQFKPHPAPIPLYSSAMKNSLDTGAKSKVENHPGAPTKSAAGGGFR